MGTPGLFVAFRLWLLNLVISQEFFSWILNSEFWLFSIL